MSSSSRFGNQDTVKITFDEGRYARLRAIPWWNQDVLASARVLVVGAGALGNEIIKNLALLGIGRMVIIDFDSIENSNLSRSVLYRSENEGETKAFTAASAARQINPSCKVAALNADITREVGLGVFRWADIIIGGLDNTDARVAVNRACWKVSKPWVDGAMESLQGVVRVFTPPEGPCFECTLSDREEQFLAHRNSCGFIAREAHRHGGAPTTPTTSSVIAGMQVQEAVKILHPDAPLQSLAGKGFFFDGGSYDCFTITYTLRDDCPNHEPFPDIIQTSLNSQSNTLADVIDEAEAMLGGPVTIELPAEMVVRLECGSCGNSRDFYRLLPAVDMEEAQCAGCGSIQVPRVVTQCRPSDAFAAFTLRDLGFATMEILQARSGDKWIGLEMSGDGPILFGEAT